MSRWGQLVGPCSLLQVVSKAAQNTPEVPTCPTLQSDNMTRPIVIAGLHILIHHCWAGAVVLPWGDYDPSWNVIVTLGKGRVGDKVEPRSLVLELLVDPLSDTRVMPTPQAINTACNYLSCWECESWSEQPYIGHKPLALKTITELMKWPCNQPL